MQNGHSESASASERGMMKGREAPPTIFDYTMCDAWADCPRKFYWWYIRRVEAVSTPIYFTAGRAWGAALARYHASPSPIAVAEANLELIHVFSEENALSDDSARGHKNLSFLLGRYALRYPPGSEPWTIVAGETGFALPFRAIRLGADAAVTLYLGGSLDFYIHWPPYGTLPVENKTTIGQLDERFLSSWNLSKQPTFYCWAVSQLSGEAPFGCLMNLTSLYTLKTKETPLDRSFSRSLQKRDSFTAFEREVELKAEAIWRAFDDWEFPMFGRFCFGGYGLSPCLYRHFCASSGATESWEDVYIPPSEYRISTKEWRPWAREGSDV